MRLGLPTSELLLEPGHAVSRGLRPARLHRGRPALVWLDGALRKCARRDGKGSGVWNCPYTGKRITDPGLIDVDHLVPLREAHLSGGHSWPQDQKRLYFNSLDNPNHLRAVDRSANRSKGSRQPHEWLPTENVCQYLRDWVTVKLAWSLESDCDEARAVSAMLVEHCR